MGEGSGVALTPHTGIGLRVLSLRRSTSVHWPLSAVASLRKRDQVQARDKGEIRETKLGSKGREGTAAVPRCPPWLKLLLKHPDSMLRQPKTKRLSTERQPRTQPPLLGLWTLSFWKSQLCTLRHNMLRLAHLAKIIWRTDPLLQTPILPYLCA